MLVSTTLTNVKTCFIILVGILSSNCRDFPLFMTPRLLILDTFVGPRATIRTPFPLLYLCGTVKSMVFKIGMFLVITGCKKKKRNVRFSVWCTGVVFCGRLLVVSVRLLVVCSSLFVFCGHWLFYFGSMWLFTGGLWSFVVVWVVCSRWRFK